MKIKNSLVYSVSYKNYQSKILIDNENMTQGSWKISSEMIRELKYAYVYLKNSEHMIVKKYQIDFFELNDNAKGYDNENKQCFVFRDSEDVFFEYPFATIQGRHYRNNEEMDVVPMLDKGEIVRRLELSKNIATTSESNRKEKRNQTGIKQEAQIRLMQLFKEEYSNRKMPHFEVSKKMIKTIKEDSEQDLNALLDEHYLSEDRKKNL
jgi:hypothetical protein